MELIRGDIHHNEAFDGAGIYVKGSVRVWTASGTNIRDNVAPAEGTSNFKGPTSSQWPRYCVTHKDTGIIESTVATWNDDFESRSESDCRDKSADHRWIWPGFTLCPEGMYTSSTRQEAYETNILGCPTFCASGKYSGPGAGFRITCSNACDRGAYCPAGSVNPYPCPGGTYGTEAGQFLVTSCKNCLAGFYTDGQAPATSCKSCPAGYAQHLASSSYCLPCIPGKYNDQETGQTLCKGCTKGQFQSNSGQTGCSDCRSGTFASQEAATKCEQCPLGRYSSETGKGECLTCPPSKYQDMAGSVKCKMCGVAGTAPNDAQTDCINPTYTVKSDCKDTEYLDNADPDRDNHLCRPCPAGASCIGWIDWTEVSGVFGWWRCPAKSGATKGKDVMKTTKTKRMNGNSSTVTVVRPETFERCSFAASCLGKENKDLEIQFILSPNISREEQCNEGYVNNSRLCYACESGYSHAGDLTGRYIVCFFDICSSN
jgi:hypothetical protein